MFKDTVTRVYRETVNSYGNESIERTEAIASATATLMVEHRVGRLEVDVERAIHAALLLADAADGRSGDSIIHKAASGKTALTLADLDVVVTLGGGLRKSWEFVTTDDLASMHDLRYANYKAARDSYESFYEAYLALRPVLFRYETFGAAFAAGGFPPKTAQAAAA
jgi:hypothetical protein